jgi:diguanylate cyclase (GGDEF)-like protein
VGVLRVRRQEEGFDGPLADALEETLVESAKHIALAIKKDQDDRKAITDGLTGLYIKRHFLESLDAQTAATREDHKPFTLVMADIDHFKQVNDTHGHLSGDFVLKGVAGALKTSLRSGDKAFRYGGEELAMLMPETNVEAARQTAERLRETVANTFFQGEKQQIIPVTISLGIAHSEGQPSPQELISRADQALYHSKRNGRNRVTVWSPSLPEPAEEEHPAPLAAKKEGSPG